MGANNKYEAAYHGREYTPTTGELRDIWVDYNLNPLPRSQGIPLVETAQADFDRWLETVRAEAKAEAYKDAADALHAEARWQTDLLLRHEEYRFRHCANRMTEMENVMLARANQYKEAPSA